MPVPTTITDLSVATASNSPAGGEQVGPDLDNYLRAIQAILRRTNAKGTNIASASTTDIGASVDGDFVDVTGTTTITGLGTVAAGVVRTVRFTGSLTLTYNATSLILPGAANIQTAANDIAVFRSLGSGDWICEQYSRAVYATQFTVSGPLLVGTTTPPTPVADYTYSVINSTTTAHVGRSSVLYQSDGTTYASTYLNSFDFLGAQARSFVISSDVGISIESAQSVGISVGGGSVLSAAAGNLTISAISSQQSSGASHTAEIINSSSGTALKLVKHSSGFLETFYDGASIIGNIYSTTTSVAYNTTSDYRLKNNCTPLTGSGDFIDALFPKRWLWNDGSSGVGFLAHEVQKVSPSSVFGEKDAIEENGSPAYQTMEYGSAEFIANIIAELKSLRRRVAALEGA